LNDKRNKTCPNVGTNVLLIGTMCSDLETWVHTSKDKVTRDTLLLTHELKLRRGIFPFCGSRGLGHQVATGMYMCLRVCNML